MEGGREEGREGGKEEGIVCEAKAFVSTLVYLLYTNVSTLVYLLHEHLHMYKVTKESTFQISSPPPPKKTHTQTHNTHTQYI
jgi:hypothetical protein